MGAPTHRRDLLDDWERARRGLTLVPAAPLIQKEVTQEVMSRVVSVRVLAAAPDAPRLPEARGSTPIRPIGR